MRVSFSVGNMRISNTEIWSNGFSISKSNFQIWKCCISDHDTFTFDDYRGDNNKYVNEHEDHLVDTDGDTSNEEHGNDDNKHNDDHENHLVDTNTDTDILLILMLILMRITLLILMASSLLVRSQVSKSREAVEESICIVHWKQYWCEIHNS